MESIKSAIEPRTTTAFAVLSLYLITCRALRYRRMKQKHAQYPYKTEEDFRKMTTEHAFEIVDYVANLEFPFLSEKALQFALFRTYGIPSISKLLCETKQLSAQEYAPRRYEDTTVLIQEFLSHSPTSTRANAGIARMNYLHGRYQKAGKISNDDMLYTLSLFVLEVERWTRLYEWRSLTDMEKCAFGTLWKSIGDGMRISFAPLNLPSTPPPSGLTFFNAVRAWSLAYETRTMLPTPSNHTLALETVAILLSNIPTPLHGFGKNAISTLMDTRLRTAMVYPSPPSYIPPLISFILNTRKYVLRYLSLPRPEVLKMKNLSPEPDKKTGRYYQREYEIEPWYVEATFARRWLSVVTWYKWATGRPYPDGKNWMPEGYRIEDVGPRTLEGKGRDVVDGEVERLMKWDGGRGRGGCPFAVGR